MHQPDILIGVDLGQAHDPTAIVVLDRRETLLDTNDPANFDRKARRWESEVRYAVPYIHRPPLGTRYPEVCKLVVDLVGDLKRKRKPSRIKLLVDATGVGKPVTDLMLEHGLRPIPVLITGGNKPTVGRGTVNIPKKVLVSALNIVLGENRLSVAKRLTDAEVLVKELQAFRMKQTSAGNLTFEAWRESDHDDIVLATAIPIWWGENKLGSLVKQPPPPRLPITTPRPPTLGEALREHDARRERVDV